MYGVCMCGVSYIWCVMCVSFWVICGVCVCVMYCGVCMWGVCMFVCMLGVCLKYFSSVFELGLSLNLESHGS